MNLLSSSNPLPPVLAGPILRRLEARRLVLWLVGSASLHLTLMLVGRSLDLKRQEVRDAIAVAQDAEVLFSSGLAGDYS